MLDLLTVSCPPRGPILLNYKPYFYDKVIRTFSICNRFEM